MTSIRLFTGWFAILALTSGLSGCGGGNGPAAGMPDNIPPGVAPVLSAGSISPKDMKKTGPRAPAPGRP